MERTRPKVGVSYAADQAMQRAIPGVAVVIPTAAYVASIEAKCNERYQNCNDSCDQYKLPAVAFLRNGGSQGRTHSPVNNDSTMITDLPANGIEILSVDLLDEFSDLVDAIRHRASGLGIQLGWHYDLDLAWIVSQFEDPKLQESLVLRERLAPLYFET